MSVYDYTAQTPSGSDVPLRNFQNHILVIVNTASHCGFTPQYQGLQELYDKFRDRGVTVLAFPCNQFGRQEPGSNEQIQDFCQTHYHVTFPVFAKIDVNGSQAHPLYQFLTKSAPGLLGTESIKWNFTKFLIDRSGNVIKRYAPSVAPTALEADIEERLQRHAQEESR